MLVGRKLKEKAVDAVLDKVNLPDPVENAIKIAATGNVGDLLVGMPIDVSPEEALGAVTKKVPTKRPKK
jgi:thiamine pyrophosphate-dependent acetolactate synthase large subunit-like protein